MDLSKISTPDLLALQSNDLSKVSTAGLQELQAQLNPPTQEAGFLGSMGEAFKQPARLAFPAGEFAKNQTEETRAALIEAGRPKYKQMDFSQAQTPAEYWEAAKEMAGSTIGSMAAPVAIGAAASAVTTPIGGMVAAGAAFSAQAAANNLLRSAQEQQAAIAKGKTPNPVDLGKLAIASVGEGALMEAIPAVFSKTFRAMPFLGKLIGTEGEVAGKAAEDKLVDAFENGKITYKGGIAKGVGKGVAFMIPQNVAMQALERWQAGLPVADQDAQEEYYHGLLGSAVMGGMFGGVEGVIHTAGRRADALQIQARQEPAPALAPAPTAEPSATPEAAAPPLTLDNIPGAETPAAPPTTPKRTPQEEALRQAVLQAIPEDKNAKAIGERLNLPRDAVREVLQGLQQDALVTQAGNVWKVIPEGTQKRFDFSDKRAVPTEVGDEYKPPAERLAEQQAPAPFDLTPKRPVNELEQYREKQGQLFAEPDFAADLKEKAAAAITEAGKANVSLIQKATGVTRSEAVALIAAFKDEGLIGKDLNVVKGKENVGAPEPVVGGGSPKLPVQQTEFGFPGTTESERKGLDVTSPIAKPVDVRTGEVPAPVTEERVTGTLKLGKKAEAPPKETAPPAAKAYVAPEGYVAPERESLTPAQAFEREVSNLKDMTEQAYNTRRLKLPEFRNIISEFDKDIPNILHIRGSLGLGEELPSPEVMAEYNKRVTEAKTQSVAISTELTRGDHELEYISRIEAAADKGLLERSEVVRLRNELQADKPNYAFINKKLRQAVTRKPSERPLTAKEATANIVKMRAVKAEEAARIEAEAKQKAAEQKAAVKAAEAQVAKEKAANKPEDGAIYGESDKHPDWATQHELRTNGKIVYSDAETALLRGHDIFYGNNVYTGIHKNGSYTRFDIQNFTGKLFTPEQRQKLLEARARAESDDDAKFAANPDGPFKGSKEQVVASKNIDPRYTAYLQTLINGLNIKGLRIFLFHPEDLKGNRNVYKLYRAYNYAMSAGMDRYENGSTRRFGPKGKDHYISIRSGMNEGRTVEIIAHELGHIIQQRKFDNAPKEIKAAIEAAHAAWQAKTQGMTAQEHIESLRNRETAKNITDTPETLNGKKSGDLGPYWHSFSEWFADNVSRWATTSEKPVGIVEQFFSDLGKQLRKLISLVTGKQFLPDAEVAKFLDNMAADTIAEGPPPQEPNGVDLLSSQSRSRLSPEEQHEADSAVVKTVGNYAQTLPPATKYVVEGTMGALSKIPGMLRRGAYSALSIHQLASMFSHVTNSLEQLHDLLNKRGAKLNTRLNDIGKTVVDYNKLSNKYSPAVLAHAFDVMHRTTLEQVEVLNNSERGWVRDEASPLTKQFDALDKPLRDMYEDLRKKYNDYSAEMESHLAAHLTPSAWQKIRNDFAKNKLAVYLPLFRKGDHWVSYIDQNNETVKRAFESPYLREKGIKEALAAGAKPESVERFNRIEDLSRNIPPTGFLGKVVGELRKNKVDEATVNRILEMYLDYLPAKSVLQLSRKREGTAGFEPDVLKAFANVSTGMARHLNNMEFNPSLQPIMEQFKQDMNIGTSKGLVKPDVSSDLETIINKQVDWISNPKFTGMDRFAAKAGYWSYVMDLGANVSSAFVNATHLPLVVYPLLGGKHGYAKATEAMANAHAYRMNPNKMPTDMKAVLQAARDAGAIVERHSAELAELKQMDTQSYVGVKAAVDKTLSYTFGKADLYNRETALLASYELELKANKGDKAAATKAAIKTLYDAYGSSFPEAGPQLMHNGLARTALTFKRFALNRTWVLARAFKEATNGADPAVQNAARKQLIGFFGTAFVFAGVQGMPVVGWAENLASLVNGIFGDNDTPFDPADFVKHSVGSYAFKGPLNAALNIDIAGRTGWDNMLWKDNAKRVSETGMFAAAMEHMMGPMYSYGVEVQNAAKMMEQGHMERALEMVVPRVAGNIMKGMRYATEGATTKDGVPIVKDVSAYNAMMQVFGFTPAEIAEAREEGGAQMAMEQSILNRRKAIENRIVSAIMNKDDAGRMEGLKELSAFNQKNPGAAIKGSAISSGVKLRYTKMAQSVNGVYLNKRLAPEIYAAHPEE